MMDLDTGDNRFWLWFNNRDTHIAGCIYQKAIRFKLDFLPLSVVITAEY